MQRTQTVQKHAPVRPASARVALIRRLGSSRFNYWFGYLANLSLVVWLASHAFAGPPLTMRLAAALGQLLAGLFSWTLCEYLLHRYVYHLWRSFLSQGHALHHQAPTALIGVPWYLTAAVVVTVFFLLSQLFGPASTGMVMAGTWLGYIFYCLAHHASHHWVLRNRWLKAMRRHHLIHHALHNVNWGFTTSLWDRVFGTHHDRPAYRRPPGAPFTP